MRLGKETKEKETKAGGIQFGPPLGGAAASEQKTPDAPKVGKPYELLNDRMTRARSAPKTQNAEKKKGDLPDSVIYWGAGAFLALLIFIVTTANPPARTYDYASALDGYEKYRSHSGHAQTLPPRQDLRKKVDEALYLESQEQKPVARKIWESMLASIGNDRSDPLSQIAIERIDDLK